MENWFFKVFITLCSPRVLNKAEKQFRLRRYGKSKGTFHGYAVVFAASSVWLELLNWSCRKFTLLLRQRHKYLTWGGFAQIVLRLVVPGIDAKTSYLRLAIFQLDLERACF